jgi:hypothetical protein
LKRLLLALVISAVAMPISTAGASLIYSIDEYTPLTIDLPLGPTLDFSYMFEIDEPASSGPWDVMPLQIWVGPITFLGQVAHNSTTGWLPASFAVPAGYIGTTQPIRFSVNDFGENTDPVVYLTDLPVPEPTTLALFAIGGIATAASRLRKKRT